MNPNPNPRTVSDLFPSPWLKAEDLAGRAVTVKIVAAQVETLRQFDGTQAPKLVLTFEKATKRLIVNKTQAKRLAEVTKTEAFADWVGHRVTLKPAVAQNGKLTVGIDPAPAGNGNGKPQEAAQGKPQAAGNGKTSPPTDQDFDREFDALPGHPQGETRSQEQLPW